MRVGALVLWMVLGADGSAGLATEGLAAIMVAAAKAARDIANLVIEMLRIEMTSGALK
jgi:hypothetical protein